MFNKKMILASLAMVGTLVAGAAHAGGNVYWSIGINAPLLPGGSVGTVISNGPSYYAPAPVYVEPAPVVYAPPVYVQPRPVYIQPPVYVQPRPVYYQPRPVYVQPGPVIYQGRGPQWQGHPRWGHDRGYGPIAYNEDRGGGRRGHRD